MIEAEKERDRWRERALEMEEALLKIRQWCDAYPVSVFRPLSKEEERTVVAAMGEAVSAGSDRMHASWARHILSGVRGLTDVVENDPDA